VGLKALQQALELQRLRKRGPHEVGKCKGPIMASLGAGM
jgi:hypothetical protein